jgi:heptaprenylglyceryl phosphate synthase
MADAGADIIVIGTMLEKGDWEQNFSSIVNSLRR